MEVRTYLDSGVLIAAFHSDHPHHNAARAVIDDERRVFLTSAFLELEVLPQARHYGRLREARFYELFLEDTTEERLHASTSLTTLAMSVAERHDVKAMDELHLAAAISLGADEFVTTERRTKPMYRETRVRVVHLDDAAKA